VNEYSRWLTLLTALVAAACSGPSYFEGNPQGTPLDGLGFPAPAYALAQVGCSLWVGGERTTGVVVYRSSDADPDDLVGFLEEHGGGVVQREVQRADQPTQVGKPTVMVIDDHREVAVVPVEGGVEVLAFIDDAPDVLACH
jgi:hypothetical protein